MEINTWEYVSDDKYLDDIDHRDRRLMKDNKAYGISISATTVEIGMASDLRQLLGAKNDSEVWRIAIRKLYAETTADLPKAEIIGTIEEVELNV